MEKMNCNVINDLLPLYQDEICSEETRQIVNEHLKHCDACQKTLGYMKETIAFPTDTDTTVIKKVKRRIFLEKLVIVFAVVLILSNIVFFGGLHLLLTQVPMNDILSESDVKVEEDAAGNVWLVRSSDAIYASGQLTEKYTTDGQSLLKMKKSEAQNYDGDIVIHIVLLENRLSSLPHRIFENTASIKEERNLLFQRGDEPNYAKVTITLNGKQIDLWEKTK